EVWLGGKHVEDAGKAAGGGSDRRPWSDAKRATTGNRTNTTARSWQGSLTILAMPSTHTSLHIHIVFSTKARVPSIDTAWRSDLHAYIGGCLKRLDAFPQEIGGVADHAHLLIGIKPVHAIADLVKEAKRASTEWVRESKRIQKFAWQEGYGRSPSASPRCPQPVNTFRSRRSITGSERFRRSTASFW